MNDSNIVPEETVKIIKAKKRDFKYSCKEDHRDNIEAKKDEEKEDHVRYAYTFGRDY